MRTDFGGRRWIRTTEVSDNRFTVCPLWPLGNSSSNRIDLSANAYFKSDELPHQDTKPVHTARHFI